MFALKLKLGLFLRVRDFFFFFFLAFQWGLELPVGTAELGHLGLEQPEVSGGCGNKASDFKFRPPQAKGTVTPRASLSNLAPISSQLRELSVTGNQIFHFPMRYSLKGDFFRVCGRLYQ